MVVAGVVDPRGADVEALFDNVPKETGAGLLFNFGNKPLPWAPLEPAGFSFDRDPKVKGLLVAGFPPCVFPAPLLPNAGVDAPEPGLDEFPNIELDCVVPDGFVPAVKPPNMLVPGFDVAVEG